MLDVTGQPSGWSKNRLFETLQDPCPYCGGKTKQSYVPNKHSHYYGYCLQCKSCDWLGMEFHRRDDDSFAHSFNSKELYGAGE